MLPNGAVVVFDIRKAATTGLKGNSPLGALSLKTGFQQRILENGVYPQYADSGHLLFWRPPGLQVMAVTFDPEAIEATGNPVSLPFLNNSDFTFSTQGHLVYWSRPVVAEWHLVLVDRKGVGRILRKSKRRMRHPRFSPDGSRIALTLGGGMESDLNVAILDIGRGILNPLDPSEDNGVPEWSADGSRLAFGSLTRDYDLLWTATDTSGEVQRILEGGTFQAPGSWGSNGHLLYVKSQDITTPGDIWSVSPGGEPRPLVATEFDEKQPTFSPDGEWVAFTSDRSGQEEVYVKLFRGEGTAKRISKAGGSQPRWAPDGKELFYRKGRKMIRVVTQLNQTIEVGMPQTLFEGDYNHGLNRVVRNYDVAPDGQYFMMIQSDEDEGGPTHLNVVLNWFEELKQAVRPED